MNFLIQQHIIIFTLFMGLLGYFIGSILQLIVVNFTITIIAIPISQNYFKKFLYQIVTGLLFSLTALHFYCSWATVSCLLLISSLIVLSAIDISCYLLPDYLTLSLMWLGLLTSTQHLFISAPDAIFGCVFGYLSLWLLGAIFKLLRRIDGIGRGDCKLLAALGAWCGIQALPAILLIASLSGLVIGLVWQHYKKQNYLTPLPFGPFLSLGGIIILFLQ